MTAWLFWVGVLLGADALIGLLGRRWWARHLPTVPITQIATIEAIVAVVLLTLYLVLSLR